MNIEMSDREKKIIRFAMSLARLKIGKQATKENIHNELINSDNEAIKQIALKINEAAGYLKKKKSLIVLIPEFAMWLILHSKKYNDYLPIITNEFTEYNYKQINIKKLSYIDEYLLSKMLQYAYKRLSEFYTFNMIINDTIVFTNPAIELIYDKINKNIIQKSDNMKEAIMLDSVVRLFLWMAQHDTAYRDVFFWIIYEIGNDEIKSIVKPYYKIPKDWYLNRWIDAQQLTHKKRKNNEIAEYDFSEPEKLCVPSIRRKHLRGR